MSSVASGTSMETRSSSSSSSSRDSYTTAATTVEADSRSAPSLPESPAGHKHDHDDGHGTGVCAGNPLSGNCLQEDEAQSSGSTSSSAGTSVSTISDVNIAIDIDIDIDIAFHLDFDLANCPPLSHSLDDDNDDNDHDATLSLETQINKLRAENLRLRDRAAEHRLVVSWYEGRIHDLQAGSPLLKKIVVLEAQLRKVEAAKDRMEFSLEVVRGWLTEELKKKKEGSMAWLRRRLLG